MTAEDFVDVKLTATAEKLAPVRVHGGTYEYCFVPGEALRLPAAEFASRLANTRIDGELIFEAAVPAPSREELRNADV